MGSTRHGVTSPSRHGVTRHGVRSRFVHPSVGHPPWGQVSVIGHPSGPAPWGQVSSIAPWGQVSIRPSIKRAMGSGLDSSIHQNAPWAIRHGARSPSSAICQALRHGARPHRHRARSRFVRRSGSTTGPSTTGGHPPRGQVSIRPTKRAKPTPRAIAMGPGLRHPRSPFRHGDIRHGASSRFVRRSARSQFPVK